MKRKFNFFLILIKLPHFHTNTNLPAIPRQKIDITYSAFTSSLITL